MHWLELLTDFVCVEHAEFDIAYITEIDPLWNDDETAFIFNPETSIFAHPSAQASCAADCISSISGFPIDSMFWCAGCHGSIYPFTGNVPDHISGVQTSLLLVTRMLAKLHRGLIAEGTIGVEGLCGKYSMPIMSKTQYKQQMLYPVSTTGQGGCKPLGRSDLLWASGKEKPYSGEDFGYLIWRKRNCCLF